MAVSVEWRATVLKKAHCYYRERMSSSAYRVSIQRACSSWRLPLLSYISRGARGLCEDASLSTVGANPPTPPFTKETAIQKVKNAENAWNSRDPVKVSMAYTPDCEWRNRTEFFKGRKAIREFLTRKWNKELDYKLMKELWCYQDDRIAVRFEYEYHDQNGQWFRAHGNELWVFDERGLMKRRDASINDFPIEEAERKYK